MENQRILDWIDRVDTELVRYFAKKDMTCNPLDRAMEYTVLAGGKRFRAILVMAACDALGGDAEAAIPFGIAVELLHAYSLIHDDLPCMDDDEMRRGKPSNHIVFGEANAILAGDALQAEAFHILASSPYEGLGAERRLQIVQEFAEAVGRRGMVAGQVMDLAQAGLTTDLERLKLLHARKTGALLKFCVRLGAHLAGASESDLADAGAYGETIGLLFQVVDDLLDEESTSGQLGKTAGKDKHQDKATFPKSLGAKETHAFADQLLKQALDLLNNAKMEAALLTAIAEHCRRRDH